MELEILGYIYLSKIDYDFEEVNQQLLALRRASYQTHQKIIVLHEDHDYFFPGSITGVVAYNFFKLVRHLDIPMSALIILTTHSQYKESIEPFISHNLDRPTVHSLLLSKMTWDVIAPWVSEIGNVDKDIKFNAVCMLGTPRAHRVKLGQYFNLHNFNTIQYNYNNRKASQLSATPNPVKFVEQTSSLSSLGLIYTMPHRTNQGWADIPKNSEFEFLANQPLPSSFQNPNIPDDGIAFYKNYAVDIVVETNFDYPHIFLTEKTLRPLLTKTPFVMFGPTGTLSYLKNLGFETFGDIWNEDYDAIQDPQERFIACTKVVKEVAEWPLEKAQEICQTLKNRLESNQKILLSYIDNTFKPVYNSFKVPLDDSNKKFNS